MITIILCYILDLLSLEGVSCGIEGMLERRIDVDVVEMMLADTYV